MRIERLFIGVGAQKAGTTWLARVLEDHPDIFMTPVKEIHYFDHLAGLTEHLSRRRRRSRYRKYHQRLWTQWRRFASHRRQWAWYRAYMRPTIDDAWYASLFAQRGGRRVAGEITPEYAIIGRSGFEHVKRLAPDVRVIFIMRNPVTRAWSQVLHQCRSRGIDAAALTTSAAVAMLAEPRFRELGDYVSTLDDMAAVFAPEQQLILYYEDIHADRLAALQVVTAFLGVDYDEAHFPALGERPNRSQEAALPGPVREHLHTLYRPLADEIARRIGRVPQSWAAEFGLP